MPYEMRIAEGSTVRWVETIVGDSYGDAALFIALKQLRALGAAETELAAFDAHLRHVYETQHGELNIGVGDTVSGRAGKFDVLISRT